MYILANKTQKCHIFFMKIKDDSCSGENFKHTRLNSYIFSMYQRNIKNTQIVISSHSSRDKNTIKNQLNLYCRAGFVLMT